LDLHPKWVLVAFARACPLATLQNKNASDSMHKCTHISRIATGGNCIGWWSRQNNWAFYNRVDGAGATPVVRQICRRCITQTQKININGLQLTDVVPQAV
jgi:hypothetical protein